MPVDEAATDEVAEVQSVDSYGSLEDGQPGEPGAIEASLVIGADSFADGAGTVGSEVAFTPDTRGLRASAFSAGVEVAAEGVEGTASEVTLGWGQRWWKAGEGVSWAPTFGGLTELSLGFPGGGGGAAIGETLALVESVGPVSVYLNGAATRVLTPEEDARALVLGMRAGVQWTAGDLHVVANLARDQGEAKGDPAENRAELGLTWAVGEHFTLGPGLTVGIDPGARNVGGGLVLVVE